MLDSPSSTQQGNAVLFRPDKEQGRLAAAPALNKSSGNVK
jgi:hypothetical protein